MTRRLYWVPFITLLFASCGGDDGRAAAQKPLIARDLDAIVGAKTLTALLMWNSTGYFVYRGEAMGYEYELLREFAKEHQIELRTVVVRDPAEMWSRLRSGEGDVAAARLIRTAVDQKDVAFTNELYATRPALIQRSGPPSEVDLPPPAQPILEPRNTVVAVRPVTTPAQIAGETVHLHRRSPYEERLIELQDEISGDIHVVEVADAASAETMIRRISRGEFRFTVAPENVALLKSDYFTNISVEPAIGPPQPVVWAVRPNAPRLLEELNRWIAANTALREQLYKKYFEDRRGFQERVESRYLSSETGTLSEYDALFRREATRLGWDWRLLASQAYQESRFKPDARSWAGAVGLLQLMPATAREVGVRNPRDPAQNVAGAAKYIETLTKKWRSVPDPDLRLRLILASYNAGAGHVEDARRLAEKHGANPDRWDDIAFWLVQKSKRQYYNDPVVKYGFVRGLEPVTYVQLILERFAHYKQFVQPTA